MDEATRNALTPSATTKAAYMSEFSFTIMAGSIDEDDDELIPVEVDVPWTTIKEIMAFIRSRIEQEKGDGKLTDPTCNMALRSAVFAVLRQHNVSDECFAAVASITRAALDDKQEQSDA